MLATYFWFSTRNNEIRPNCDCCTSTRLRAVGLGQKLVAECIQFAREAGYKKITLWTQSILTAAHRIYKSAGFRLVRQVPHRSFGKNLVGQTWEMDLV